MDQKKIGSFMKALRNAKNLTQEQLSEILGVSNRTISRWETGTNMPDIDLLVEISRFYDVDLRELLDGERKNEHMDQDIAQTVLKVAEYSTEEKWSMAKKMNRFSWLGIASMTTYVILLYANPSGTFFSEFLSGLMLGISCGSIILSAIFTSRYGLNIKAFKLRLFKKLKP